MLKTIKTLIDQEAGLFLPASDLTPRADLYALGLTPFTAIRLMLAIERAFEVEFSRERLNRASMGTIEAILVGLSEATPAREMSAAA